MTDTPAGRFASNRDDEGRPRTNQFRSRLGIKRPRRRRVLWVALLAFIGVDVALGVALLARHQRRIEFPEREQIVKVMIVLPKLSDAAPAADFDLDNRFIAPVLAALQPAARAEIDPRILENSLGRIAIETRDGKRMLMTFYDGGQSGVRFTIHVADGTRIPAGRAGPYKPIWTTQDDDAYVNEGVLLRALLQEIDRFEREGGPEAKINDLIKQLEQSRGDRQPSQREEA